MSSTETTITIKKSTRDDLRDCKFYRLETWNDLIIRLIKMYKEKDTSK